MHLICIGMSVMIMTVSVCRDTVNRISQKGPVKMKPFPDVKMRLKKPPLNAVSTPTQTLNTPSEKRN